MPFITALALAAAQTAPAPAIAAPAPSDRAAPAAADDVEASNAPRLATATQLLRDRQPQQALDVVAIALAAYDAEHAAEKRRLYCGMSPTETLLYLAMAAKDKTSAVAVAPGYCTAIYLKGFALVDLGRLAEARAAYRQVVALAPMHAQYLTELGQLSRLEKDWPGMLSLCEQASAAAGLGAPEAVAIQRGAALRCQGYALVEERKWGDAEKRYKEALKIDANDTKAQGELRYIAEHRKE